jgi:hypothetical protein
VGWNGSRPQSLIILFGDLCGKLTTGMIWDFEDIFFVTVFSCYLVLILWMIFRGSSLRWSNSKVAAFYLSLHCFAFFLIFLFWSATSFLPRAEIRGQVSQVNLHYPFPLERHRQFEVTSLKGLRVTIVSERHIAEALRIGEPIYVRYDPVTSEPESVERFDGASRQTVFDSQNFPILRSFRVANYGFLAATAIGFLYGIRKFLRSDR